MTISASALLAELNISVWTATVTDRKATDKTLTDSNAQYGAGLFKKNLMAGTNLRKDIADFAQSCRHWHMARTLPWLDRGGRLLPTSLFFDYKQEANKRQAKFNDMVNAFLTNYDAVVETAKNYLGDLFDAADYPSAEEVRGKFGFRLVFSPVPEAQDFRVSVAQDDMEELRQQYEESYNARINEAMQSAWERMFTLVKGMSDKLTDDPDSEVKKRYHDTLITNAQELCAMLTHLNITKDPKLESARRDLEQAIFGVDIDDIRVDPSAREDVKAKLDDMLKSYEW